MRKSYFNSDPVSIPEALEVSNSELLMLLKSHIQQLRTYLAKGEIINQKMDDFCKEMKELKR